MSFEIKRARGKTAVFSGTRQHCDFVPRLEDLCIQKLMNNANRIECVGDVPYYILKPLLTRVSLAQLKRIESYNPQLVEDVESDEPWKAHCKHHFEDRRPKAGETWRDLFHRCEREREHKIEKIAKRIKRHEEKAVPARQARFVLDQQLPGGKNRAVSAKTVITKTIKNNIPGPSGSSGKSSSSTMVIRQTSVANGSGSSSKGKPKTAPLMQKSMALFKSRFGARR